MPNRILVVDDDPTIRDVIGFAVEKAGFPTAFANDGLAALTAIRSEAFDLIVLDIGLPEMDGLAVCREVRRFSDVPILFLTALDDEIDRIVGMEIGADDYVTKPFSPRELVARIRAILKRARPSDQAENRALRWGSLEVDSDRHLCRLGDAEVALTASEFTLLTSLMRRPEHVVTRAQLMETVYGHNIHVSDRTIDSHIRNIRAKLGAAGCEDAIVTVHGVGLRMGSCRKT